MPAEGRNTSRKYSTVVQVFPFGRCTVGLVRSSSLHSARIQSGPSLAYFYGSFSNHEARRDRKLLLTKRELRRLEEDSIRATTISES